MRLLNLFYQHPHPPAPARGGNVRPAVRGEIESVGEGVEGYKIKMTEADFFILYLIMGQKTVVDIGSSAIRAENQLQYSPDQFSLTLLPTNFFLFNIKLYLSWF